MERVTGIEPAWPAWKASGTRSRLSVKMAVDLPVCVFDLDRCGPYWTALYRPYGPAAAPLEGFVAVVRAGPSGRRGSERGKRVGTAMGLELTMAGVGASPVSPTHCVVFRLARMSPVSGSGSVVMSPCSVRSSPYWPDPLAVKRCPLMSKDTLSYPARSFTNGSIWSTGQSLTVTWTAVTRMGAMLASGPELPFGELANSLGTAVTTAI
jgi:hypothetical protein